MESKLHTLPDHLARGLDIVSIGLNPSVNAVRAGFYFATRTNRFWPALNASRLVGETLTPGADAERHLLERHRIGFTDVVKRPTRGAGDLRAADFREWVPVLREKLDRFVPRIAWFHGKIAYAHFCRHGGGPREDAGWGMQAWRVGQTRIFVTPNPSAANAVYSLTDLIAWYDRLADLGA